MKQKELKEFIQCDCGSEFIILEPQDEEILECGLFLGVLEYAYHKPSFWHRFKHIWHTLKTGKPYIDQVCLDLNKVKELNKYLTNFIMLAELEKKHKKKYKKSNTILIYPSNKDQ